MARQPIRYPGKVIPARENREQVTRLLEGRRAADLPDHAPPHLVVGLDLVEHRADARGRLILEIPDQVVASGSTAVEERAREGFGKAIARLRIQFQIGCKEVRAIRAGCR